MFLTYSIGKTFLAQAILELKLPLTDKVGNYVVNLPETIGNRTIGSLLNHTSVLRDYSELQEYHQAVAARHKAWSRDELFEKNTIA